MFSTETCNHFIGWPIWLILSVGLNGTHHSSCWLYSRVYIYISIGSQPQIREVGIWSGRGWTIFTGIRVSVTSIHALTSDSANLALPDYGTTLQTHRRPLTAATDLHWKFIPKCLTASLKVWIYLLELQDVSLRTETKRKKQRLPDVGGNRR